MLGGILTTICSLLIAWVMMPTDIDASNYFIRVGFTIVIGGLIGIIGGFLLLYGFVRLVTLETIEELGTHDSTEKTE
jgi:ABC-type xylose transport system permease subunit